VHAAGPEAVPVLIAILEELLWGAGVLRRRRGSLCCRLLEGGLCGLCLGLVFRNGYRNERLCSGKIGCDFSVHLLNPFRIVYVVRLADVVGQVVKLESVGSIGPISVESD
jgi:hypothetical protein